MRERERERERERAANVRAFSFLRRLRAVDWSKVQNKNRKNVIPDGEDSCHSFILGPNM